jgi:hypothetical protein
VSNHGQLASHLLASTCAALAVQISHPQRLIDEISRGDAAGSLFSSDSTSSGGDASTSGGGREEDEAYRKALSRAMRLINFRERSSGELQGRLLEDGYDPRVVARVVLRMRELVRSGRRAGPQQGARGVPGVCGGPLLPARSVPQPNVG